MSTNSTRISHKLENLPNTFRDDTLDQVLNDIDELLNGKGYIEFARSGVFVDSAIIWNSAAKNFKRYEILVDRTANPPFVGSTTFKVYNKEGSAVVAEVTTTVTRNASKQLINGTTTIVRP
jgi:hypothetical protein